MDVSRAPPTARTAFRLRMLAAKTRRYTYAKTQYVSVHTYLSINIEYAYDTSLTIKLNSPTLIRNVRLPVYCSAALANLIKTGSKEPVLLANEMLTVCCYSSKYCFTFLCSFTWRLTESLSVVRMHCQLPCIAMHILYSCLRMLK